MLTTARESAAEIRQKAEQSAAQLLTEASDEAARMREEAEIEASRRRSDAAADAEAELIGPADELLGVSLLDELLPQFGREILIAAMPNPDNPEPYKYLGIAHLDAFYQFESAIKEISVYTEQRPHDVFGHNYLGYLYYCLQKYGKAISEFNRAIELKPDNCYAFAKLSRTYAGLYLKSAALDPRRSDYRKKAVEMFAKASATATIRSSDLS